MAHYRSVGDIPPKRHTQHRAADGKLYSEELMGEEGFSSDRRCCTTSAFRRRSSMPRPGICPTRR